MISPGEASQKLEQLMPDRKVITLPLYQCHDKVIAEDIFADSDIPPYPKSPFDGYAIRSRETITAGGESPVELTIVETFPAGKSDNDRIASKGEKTAVKVMTGSVIPGDFDAVLPWEQVNYCEQKNKIYIDRKVSTGHNIIPQGEDIVRGEQVISCGERLTPYHIGVLASVGVTEPKVYQSYKIGLLITGSELIPPDQQLSDGKIRSSNNYTLAASLQYLGQKVEDFGIVTDDKQQLKEKVELACEQVDILLTTGGVSKGDYDFVPYILQEMGAERLFWRVNMKPGTPIHAARYKNTPVISLSGNPAACMATFHLLLMPALLANICLDNEDRFHDLTNYDNYDNNDKRILKRAIPAFLAESVKKKTSSMWRFVRGKSWIGEDGRYHCVPIAKEKPSMLKTLIWANGYIVIPPDSNTGRLGDKVLFIPVEK